MAILYLTSDLMFSSRASSAAQEAGAELRVVGSVSGLLDALAEDGDVRLVVLDLSLAGFDPAAVIPQIREVAQDVTVIAYGPHVHEQKLAAAADAGCDQVLSKGQFSSSIAQLMARYAAPS